jgi:hypothetical protein
MLEVVLAFAALLIGATGTFSPCGFSAVETLGPQGHTGGRRTTIASCITFFPGAVLGGIATFGALSALGEVIHGAGGSLAYVVAAAIAILAAALEARGTPIVPQIRRQLPEHWRRVMPMPAAGALYGVLLGMGFTTFVLSFGVWALAGICLAVGDPVLGLTVGVAFGVGRAIPVVVLAPLQGTALGTRAMDLMATRPAAYIGMRRGDALALALAGLALTLSVGSAGAQGNATTSSTPAAADPSATVDALAFEKLGGQGFIQRAGTDTQLPGSDPAIGGPYAVALDNGTTHLVDRATLNPVVAVPTPNADALAVSQFWLVYRAKLQNGGDGIFARSILDPAAPGPLITVTTVAPPAQLSPPSVDGSTLLYGVARPRGSRIVQRTLGKRKRRMLVRSRRALLFNPAVKGRAFVYVRSEKQTSRLMLRKRGKVGRGKSLVGVRRSRGMLTSTALTEGHAYVTLLHPDADDPGAEVLGVKVKRGKKHRRKHKKRR